MTFMTNLIAITAVLTIFFGGLTVSSAWLFGGEFYIKGNVGKRKNWLERLLDGFEALRKM